MEDIGIDYVLIGHSEQRELLAESNNVLSSKINKAMDENLGVIFCVGESLEVKNNNETELFISEQLDVIGEAHFRYENQMRALTVAYEPIWAIGTGKIPNQQEIEEVHKVIKSELNNIPYLKVIYGGSVNQKNCNEIFSISGVDGALIGGASLNFKEFLAIYKSGVKYLDSFKR